MALDQQYGQERQEQERKKRFLKKARKNFY